MWSSTPPAVSEASPAFVSASTSDKPSACRYQSANCRGARDPRTTLRRRGLRPIPVGIQGVRGSEIIKRTPQKSSFAVCLSLPQLDDLDEVALRLDQPGHAQIVQPGGGRTCVLDVEIEDHPPGLRVLVSNVVAAVDEKPDVAEVAREHRRRHL